MAQNANQTKPEQLTPTSTETPLGISEIMELIKQLNVNLERDIESRGSWKLALRNGLLGAVGGLVGSSIIIAAVVHFARPLAQIVELRPALERIANQQSAQVHATSQLP